MINGHAEQLHDLEFNFKRLDTGKLVETGLC